MSRIARTLGWMCLAALVVGLAGCAELDKLLAPSKPKPPVGLHIMREKVDPTQLREAKPHDPTALKLEKVAEPAKKPDAGATIQGPSLKGPSLQGPSSGKLEGVGAIKKP